MDGKDKNDSHRFYLMYMSKFNYKKKYGQNFLMDENVLERINKEISVSSEELIIEIGPGSGKLTKYLVKHHSYYIGFEIDIDTKKHLNEYENEKVKFIYSDFLSIDLSTIIDAKLYKNIYVVANLPYYITTPIITKIIESKININGMILMVQKEVAERLSANPGTKDYGYFTVYLNCHYTCSKLFNVSRKAFEPVPKVDSAIIKLVKNSICLNIDSSKFSKFIKDAFHLKRKNLKNNLYNYDLKKIETILIKNNYSLTSRAEDLPLHVFIEIYNEII